MSEVITINELYKAHVRSHIRTRKGKMERVQEHERRIPSSEELAAQNVPTRDVLHSVCSPTAVNAPNREYKYNPQMVEYCKKLRGRIEKHLLSMGVKRKAIEAMYKLIESWNTGHTGVQFGTIRRAFSRLGEVVDGKITLDDLLEEEMENQVSIYRKWKIDNAFEFSKRSWDTPKDRQRKDKERKKELKKLEKETEGWLKVVRGYFPSSVIPIFKELRTISRVLYNQLYDGKGIMYRGISDSADNKTYAKDLLDKLNRTRWSDETFSHELEARGGVSFTPHINVGKFFANFNARGEGKHAVIAKRILPEQVEMFWPVLNGELNDTVDTREVIVRFPKDKIPLTKEEVVW